MPGEKVSGTFAPAFANYLSLDPSLQEPETAAYSMVFPRCQRYNAIATSARRCTARRGLDRWRRRA
jgi:hypothetical protein